MGKCHSRTIINVLGWGIEIVGRYITNLPGSSAAQGADLVADSNGAAFFGEDVVVVVVVDVHWVGNADEELVVVVALYGYWTAVWGA